VFTTESNPAGGERLVSVLQLQQLAELQGGLLEGDVLRVSAKVELP
jgi:hypothetical protein